MSRKNSSILIVDDDPEIRHVFRLMLREEPIRIFEAADGLDALEQIELRTPNLVILDVIMPKMNGFKVCEQVRKNKDTAKLAILMVTAQVSFRNQEKGLQAGANKYLNKPISRKELIQAIYELLPESDKNV